MFTHVSKISVKGPDGKDLVAEAQKKEGQEKTGTYTKVAFHATGQDKDGNYVSEAAPEVLFKQAIDFLAKDDPKVNPIVHLLDLATYAFDLNQRASVRQSVLSVTEGPEKAIEKAANDLMKARAANGKPITIEMAREKVKAMLAD